MRTIIIKISEPLLYSIPSIGKTVVDMLLDGTQGVSMHDGTTILRENKAGGVIEFHAFVKPIDNHQL